MVIPCPVTSKCSTVPTDHVTHRCQLCVKDHPARVSPCYPPPRLVHVHGNENNQLTLPHRQLWAIVISVHDPISRVTSTGNVNALFVLVHRATR
jgi:hypothetical protein